MDHTPPSAPVRNALDAMDWQPLHPSSIRAERLGAIIFWCVLASAALVGLIIAYFASGATVRILGSIALGILVLLSLLGMLFWFSPLWAYRAYRWREVGQGIEIKRGYLWWHRIYVPRERIQHTDVVRGPIMRRYGIASLVIHTAGSHNHTIQIDGLAEDVAESLRESLLPSNPLHLSSDSSPATPPTNRLLETALTSDDQVKSSSSLSTESSESNTGVVDQQASSSDLSTPTKQES